MSDFFDKDVYKPVFSPVIRITKNKEKPIFVSDIGDKENVNIFEEALEVKKIMQEGSLPLMKAAKFLGYDGREVANKLRLLEFSEDERKLILENEYSEEEALYFLQLDKENRIKAMEYCSNENLRQKCIEEYIIKMLEKTPVKNKNSFEVKDIGFFENSLKKTLKLAEKMGFEACIERQDEHDYHLFTIKVKRKNSKLR